MADAPTEITDPPTPPAAPDGAAAGATGTAPTEPPKPFAVFNDADSFNKRMDQATRAKLREMGIESPEQFSEMKAQHTKLQEDAETRRQETLSEIEREREARTKFESAATASAAAAEEAQQKASLYEVFAKKGVRNCDYAYWETLRQLDQVPEGETLDAAKFVDGLLADKTKAAALGVAPVVTTQGLSDTDTGRDPQTAPAGGGAGGDDGVLSMSKDEFNVHLRKTHGHHAR